MSDWESSTDRFVHDGKRWIRASQIESIEPCIGGSQITTIGGRTYLGTKTTARVIELVVGNEDT